MTIRYGSALEHQMLGRKLWVTLCEIESGLFSVRYRSNVDDGSVHDMPIYQVATCVADAEQRIENRARTCGFDAVVWDHAGVGAAPSWPLPEARTYKKGETPLVVGQ
jgi:hypothetical protein